MIKKDLNYLAGKSTAKKHTAARVTLKVDPSELLSADYASAMGSDDDEFVYALVTDMIDNLSSKDLHAGARDWVQDQGLNPDDPEDWEEIDNMFQDANWGFTAQEIAKK